MCVNITILLGNVRSGDIVWHVSETIKGHLCTGVPKVWQSEAASCSLLREPGYICKLRRFLSRVLNTPSWHWQYGKTSTLRKNACPTKLCNRNHRKVSRRKLWPAYRPQPSGTTQKLRHKGVPPHRNPIGIWLAEIAATYSLWVERASPAERCSWKNSSNVSSRKEDWV